MTKRLIPCNNCRSLNFKKLVTIKGNRGVEFISKKHNIVVCKNCGLVFINPQHSDNDYALFYEKFNNLKTHLPVEEILKRHEYQKKHINFLLENITDLKNQSILEVGSGAGAFLYFLKQQGFTAEGIEPSDEVINVSKKLNVKVSKGWLFDNNIEKKYDVLVNQDVIEHLTNPLEGIKKMSELLKVGGYLCIITEDYNGLSLRAGIGKHFKFVHTFYFTETTLKSLLLQAGFRIIRSKTTPPNLSGPQSRINKSNLLVVAQKLDSLHFPASPLKDDVDKIFKVFRDAKKRDRWFMWKSNQCIKCLIKILQKRRI